MPGHGGESPFSQSLREHHGPEVTAENPAVHLEFMIDQDVVLYRVELQDGAFTRWHKTNIPPDSSEMCSELKQRLLKRYGLSGKERE
jgi:hypothetical protein